MPEKPHVFVSKGMTYHILSTLKPGPGNRVYKALRKNPSFPMEQEVILKVFPKRTNSLKDEFESLRDIRSFYSIQLLGFEFFNGNPAFVLESVQGVSLLQLIHHFTLSSPEVRCLLSQIYKGLKDLKTHQLCHGDLSLNNVLINKEGRIKFIDFGRGNYNHSLQGTPPFIAPEVLHGGRPNFFSDLFSLGVLERFLKNPHQLSRLKIKNSADFLSENQPLLSKDPKNRYFTPSPLLPEDLSSLSYKVKDLLSLLEERNWSTREIQPTKNRNFLIMGFLILSFLTGVPSSSKPQTNGLLHIRTHQWILIKINKDTQYAPVEKSLPPGVYHLQWSTPTKSGEKTIHIPSGQVLFLTDRDF
ncbi:MAG: protein kinase [Bdellovibrionales bacterium]|nr:protein kinase [Bdellovibrionales bacterium]